VLECDAALAGAWLSCDADIPAKAAAWIETLASYREAAEDQKPKSLKGKGRQGECRDLKRNLLTLSFSAFLLQALLGGESMRYLIAVILFIGSVLPGWAHGGGTDANGCHHDHKNGGYHCH